MEAAGRGALLSHALPDVDSTPGSPMSARSSSVALSDYSVRVLWEATDGATEVGRHLPTGERPDGAEPWREEPGMPAADEPVPEPQLPTRTDDGEGEMLVDGAAAEGNAHHSGMLSQAGTPKGGASPTAASAAAAPRPPSCTGLQRAPSRTASRTLSRLCSRQGGPPERCLCPSCLLSRALQRVACCTAPRAADDDPPQRGAAAKLPAAGVVEVAAATVATRPPQQGATSATAAESELPASRAAEQPTSPAALPHPTPATARVDQPMRGASGSSSSSGSKYTLPLILARLRPGKAAPSQAAKPRPTTAAASSDPPVEPSTASAVAILRQGTCSADWSVRAMIAGTTETELSQMSHTASPLGRQPGHEASSHPQALPPSPLSAASGAVAAPTAASPQGGGSSSSSGGDSTAATGDRDGYDGDSDTDAGPGPWSLSASRGRHAPPPATTTAANGSPNNSKAAAPANAATSAAATAGTATAGTAAPSQPAPRSGVCQAFNFDGTPCLRLAVLRAAGGFECCYKHSVQGGPRCEHVEGYTGATPMACGMPAPHSHNAGSGRTTWFCARHAPSRNAACAASSRGGAACHNPGRLPVGGRLYCVKHASQLDRQHAEERLARCFGGGSGGGSGSSTPRRGGTSSAGSSPRSDAGGSPRRAAVGMQWQQRKGRGGRDGARPGLLN